MDKKNRDARRARMDRRDEIYSIADGMSRDEIARRAQQAYMLAEEARARRIPVFSIPALEAISRATAWGAVFEDMNASGQQVFIRAGKSPAVPVEWADNLRLFRLTFRMYLTRKPVDWDSDFLTRAERRAGVRQR